MTKKQRLRIAASTLSLGIALNILGGCSNGNIQQSNNVNSYSGYVTEETELDNYKIYKLDLSLFCNEEGELSYPIPMECIVKDGMGYIIEKPVTRQVVYPAEKFSPVFGPTVYRTTRGGKLSGDKELVTVVTYEMVEKTEAETVLQSYLEDNKSLELQK